MLCKTFWIIFAKESHMYTSMRCTFTTNYNNKQETILKMLLQTTLNIIYKIV